MKSRVVFRVDADNRMGTGHVARCINLARILQGRGAEILFLQKSAPGDLICRIGVEFEVYELSKSARERKEDEKALLLDSVAQDHDDWYRSAPVIKSFDPEWIVVDNYGLTDSWESKAREFGRVMVIDDLSGRSHDCDLLTDPNRLDEFRPSVDFDLIGSGRKLLGPRYALIGEEYKGIMSCPGSRFQDRKRILVCFGGLDRTNRTGKVINALIRLNTEAIAIDVAVGGNYPHLKTLEEARRRFSNLYVYQNRPSLVDLVSKADLAIGGPGLSFWERLASGVPNAIISINPRQKKICKALQRAGLAYYLGDAANTSLSMLSEALEVLVEEWDQVPGQGTNKACTLVDGNGARRVASHMMGISVPLSFRAASKFDVGFLRHLMPEDVEEQAACGNVNSCLDIIRVGTSFTQKHSLRDDTTYIVEAADGLAVGRFNLIREFNNRMSLAVKVDPALQGLDVLRKIHKTIHGGR